MKQAESLHRAKNQQKKLEPTRHSISGEHDSTWNIGQGKHSPSNRINKKEQVTLQMSVERINEVHNPYNLTGVELEQLRHKNKMLISKFFRIKPTNLENGQDVPSTIINQEHA